MKNELILITVVRKILEVFLVRDCHHVIIIEFII